ncbi:amidohydrolase [Arthrobacter sp. MYb227]|uniref:amidohydrolase n=1 Tax=Arthrobacter sp. MYb227 TaxID=1848601 RepID=UPI000CFB9E2D|nr:amidohydrolase [Arthrobacter sp. MYb227]PQZ95018.1 amidohydrolase [Arthrobacter sp. MYb227]
MNATTILHNATIITVDEDFSTAEAIAFKDGMIVAIGSTEKVMGFAGPATEIHNMEGSTVLPGFVEAHGHPTAEMNFIGPDAIDIRASLCGSAEVVLEKLRDAVAEAEASGPGAWVAAFGWDPLLLPDLPRISGAWLTEFSPTVPLSIMHYSAHSAWANDAALLELGLDRNSEDPGASQYLRDETGELTGEALEIPAVMNFMGPKMHAGAEKFSEFLDFELYRMAAAGVTTTGDLAFHPDSYPLMQEYQRTHEPPARIRSYEMSGIRANIPAPGTDPLMGTSTAMFRPTGVKVWTDGSPWVGNIETSFGYEDSIQTEAIGLNAGHQGCSNYTEEQLLTICRQHYANGWQMACHVHGDIAVDTVLSVFEQVQREFPRADGRLRMEHCGSITPQQVKRAWELGVGISFFVAHIHYYGDILAGLFGENAEAWTPAGAAAEAGMRFSLHNDPPVTPESPLINMQAAILRQTPSGKVLGPEFRIDIRDAIKAQTIDAAWQLFSDHEVGSLEIGKFADIVVLERNPLDVSAHELGNIRIQETWIDGRRVRAHVPVGATSD